MASDNDPLYAQVFLFPERRKPIQHPLNRASLEHLTAVIEMEAAERKERPETVALLERFPPLLARYLMLAAKDRRAFAGFHQSYKHYLTGSDIGDYIQSLANRARSSRTVTLARECRYVHQLLTYFEFHQQHTPDVPFTAQYLRSNPDFCRSQRTNGRTWVKNVRSAGTTMSALVDVASYAAPEILACYDSRELRQLRREKIARLSP